MSLLNTDDGATNSGDLPRPPLSLAIGEPDGVSLASTLRAQGPLGEVCIHLQRCTGGLYVEREDIPRRGLRTWQAIYFMHAADFERWCNDDPLRFEHPLVHAQLRRQGDFLIRQDIHIAG